MSGRPRRPARARRADDSFLRLCNAQRHARVPRAKLAAALRAAFRLVEVSPLPVLVTLVDDREIARLHRRFSKAHGATDVLSFPLVRDENDEDGDVPFGEVVVSVETAVREARANGHPVEAEVVLYATHGVLHLLGYDDRSAADRRDIREAERWCLAAAGIRRDLFAIGKDLR